MNSGPLHRLKAGRARDPMAEVWGAPSRPRFRRLLYSSLGILFLLLIVGIFNREGFLEVLNLREEVAGYRENISRLQKENTLLIEEIDSLRHDPSHVEKIAREELGLAFPEETVFVFPDS